MTFLMIVTLLLSAGLYLAREYFAASYHDPLLLMFLDITIIAAIVESISLPVVALLRREMAFGMLARIRTAGSGFGAAVTIGMATCGFGHMCFAFGLLASALMTTGLAMAIYPLGRLLRPSFASIDVAWRFGIYLGGNAGLNKICETFPQLMLGRFMPIASVGIYNRANTVSGLPDRVFFLQSSRSHFPCFRRTFVQAAISVAPMFGLCPIFQSFIGLHRRYWHFWLILLFVSFWGRDGLKQHLLLPSQVLQACSGFRSF